jgi:hypothetical protein
MAFGSASGWSNLPQGNFSPVIFSKRAQLAFRRRSVIQAITNSDYFGEISSMGDTVRIIKEPAITVRSYARGTQVVAQDLDDDELTLTVDQGNYFSFPVDDIEKKHAHHDWMALASDRGGFELKNSMDSEVLTYIDSQIPTANQIGTEASPSTIAASGATHTPLEIMNELKRVLDQADVPEEDRWFVADPFFFQLLGAEGSTLLSSDYTTTQNILRNGRISEGLIRGFNVFMSNNLGTVGTGSTATSGTNGTWLIAGHGSAVATAEQILNVESLRSQDTFGDIVRGLHVYGRKALRTNALVGSLWRTV